MSAICYIDFENSELNAFYAGQMLRGTVRLILTKKKTFRGIYIHIKGNAFVKWRMGNDKYCTFGTEDYLDEKMYLIGGMNGKSVSLGLFYESTECKFMLNVRNEYCVIELLIETA